MYKGLLKIHRSCTRICVDERGDCLPRSCTKGDNHDFLVVIMTSPFFPVAYPFLPGKRPSTRIYGYATGNLPVPVPVPVHGHGLS